jgi:hypothetical protein
MLPALLQGQRRTGTTVELISIHVENLLAIY